MHKPTTNADSTALSGERPHHPRPVDCLGSFSTHGNTPDDGLIPIIDMRTFGEFAGDRSIDRFVRLLAVLIMDLETKANSLGQIFSSRDDRALRMLAHSAVGSGSMIGTTRLVRLGRSIEMRCANRETIDWSTAEELLPTIRETIDALKEFGSRDAVERLISADATVK